MDEDLIKRLEFTYREVWDFHTVDPIADALADEAADSLAALINHLKNT